MAEKKVGTVVYWRRLSEILAVFRMAPQDSPFPEYKAGQYIALSRDDCWLTRRVIGPDGRPHYEHLLDESGAPRRGSVTHSYSICSAPFETRERGTLEFYVVLEKDERGDPGRLTESMFRIDPPADDRIGYVNRIVGDFTLDRRAAGFRSVVWVGTGTGLAPFASMVKQLDHEAAQGPPDGVHYTLLHANRTYQELAYHEELLAIEAARRFDFVYIPSVSRPGPRDLADPRVGKGRANNVLRHVFGMPLKEHEDLASAEAAREGVERARAALEGATRPALPAHVSRQELVNRLEPRETVILTCGNPSLMADIRTIAGAQGIRFEKEDW
jgi:ferredoxin-NADP reductase